MEALKEFFTNPGVLLFSTTVLIEIVPIKINPWRSLFKWIGSVINAEDRDNIKKLEEKLDVMQKDMSEMKREREDDKAKEKRWHILDFINSCRHGRTHTREEWNHTLSELAEYEKFTEDHDIPNGVIDEGSKYLRELFQENNKTNNFL